MDYEQKELHQIIIKDIQEIYSLVNRFENPNQVHQIDIDLAMSKVRNLYDLLLKLNAQGTYQPEYQKEEKSTIHKPVEKHHEQEVVEVVKDEPKIIHKVSKEIEQPDPVIVIEKKKKKLTPKKPVEPKKEVVVKEEKPKKEPVKVRKHDGSAEIMADKFQSKTYMHDTFGKEKIDQKDVSSKAEIEAN
ncbi:MAG: hypothetical protein MZU84_09595 [Sphingobacterium sp.]|nr:hypothetical protein [Sphingobacterium sp.]